MPHANLFLALLLIVPSLTSLPTSLAWGGNKVMVEKRVQEMDQLNKKLLAQETEIPQNGRLELKAEVRYEAAGDVDLRVYSRKFSTISEEPIRINGRQTPVPSN